MPAETRCGNFHLPTMYPRQVAPGLVTDQMLFSSPIAIGSDETLYLGSGDGEFSAFSSQGDLKWTYNGGPLRGTAFFRLSSDCLDNTILALSTQATIYAFTPDGALRWSVHVGDPIKIIFQPLQPLPALAAMEQFMFLSPKARCLVSVGEKDSGTSALGRLTCVSDPGDRRNDLCRDQRQCSMAQCGPHKGLMSSSWPKYQHDLAKLWPILDASANKLPRISVMGSP